MKTVRRKDYLNPRGEGIVIKSGVTLTSGQPVELERGTNFIKLPVDYSDRMIGLVAVNKTGIVQQTDEATIEVAHDYRITCTAGEAIQSGDALMWNETDKKVRVWYPVMAEASQTITLATNAAGGTHTITIDGIAIAVAVTAADTPTVAAGKVVTALRASVPMLKRGIYASNSAGVVTITSKRGALDNATTVAVATDDATQTIVAGAATMTGGVGYPQGSVIGRALQNIANDAEGMVLVRIGG